MPERSNKPPRADPLPEIVPDEYELDYERYVHNI